MVHHFRKIFELNNEKFRNCSKNHINILLENKNCSRNNFLQPQKLKYYMQYT